MRRHFTGDVWTDAKLLQAEDLVVEARAAAACRALLRDSRSPRRGVRVRLGAVLLAMGHRLLGSLAGLDPEVGDAPGRADWGRRRPACPVCRSPGLEAPPGPRPH